MCECESMNECIAIIMFNGIFQIQYNGMYNGSVECVSESVCVRVWFNKREDNYMENHCNNCKSYVYYIDFIIVIDWMSIDLMFVEF